MKFGVDIGSLGYVDIRKKDYLSFGKDPTHGLIDTKLTAEDCNKQPENICFSLHYNGSNSFLFINGAKTNQFKAKALELNANSPCLCNISNDFLTWKN